ncbi:MAG: hypothetical protein RLZZ156_1756 [Deinococcota bacterium]
MNLETRLQNPDIDDFERELLETVRDYGWQVTMIPEDDEGSAFAFSVGFEATLGHPEIILFGLRLETMHSLINFVGDKIKSGSSFEHGQVATDILEGYEVMFATVPKHHYPEFLGAAQWFYETEDFTVLQMIYPDRLHRFPWDEKASPKFLEQQPILGVR